MLKNLVFLALSATLFALACKHSNADPEVLAKMDQSAATFSELSAAEGYLTKIQSKKVEVEALQRADTTNIKYKVIMMPLNDLEVMAKHALTIPTLKANLAKLKQDYMDGKITTEEAKTKSLEMSNRLSEANSVALKLDELMKEFDRRLSNLTAPPPAGKTIR